jgi:hypothetical protein
MVKLDHVVRFLQLRGGDVNGARRGARLAARGFPGTTHFFGLSRTNPVRDVVLTFLDPPPAPGWSDSTATGPG